MKTVHAVCFLAASVAAVLLAVADTNPAAAQSTFAVPVSPPSAFIKAGRYLINPSSIAYVVREAEEQIVGTGAVTIVFVGDSKIVLTKQDAADAWNAFSRYPVIMR